MFMLHNENPLNFVKNLPLFLLNDFKAKRDKSSLYLRSPWNFLSVNRTGVWCLFCIWLPFVKSFQMNIIMGTVFLTT